MDIKTRLDKLPSLRLTVEAHGLMAKKSLGQNFLLDRNVTDKIIQLSLNKQSLNDFSGSKIYEIGPGPGGLTRSILEQNPYKLTVIEMDDRAIAIMQEIKDKVEDKLEIINGDAMKFDIKTDHIISNLPYNISVPLLMSWLKKISSYKSLTLMFQKEVAERIMAPTDCKDYGRISIIAQLLCKIDKLMDVSPQCFTPAPKIWSTVLLFRPLHADISDSQLGKIEKLTSLAFGQRRKMIRQSLKSIPDLEAKCLKLGIELTSRAENITPQQYLALADLL